MKNTVEVVCLDGLEAAIIGQTTRDGKTEVLVYDAALVSKLLLQLGYIDFDAFDFEMQLIETDGVETQKRPVFVYLDRDVKDRLVGTPSFRRRDTPLH